ncbi:BspA family leucine-rich repeat surface protein [uncultured Ruminococcus sp.]|uniref:BspA family leucine-rich repeat surface protein n=1 Tax=uncultured Ruminococcus sp. TaxID=165186 RepID=UPI0026147E16|nr:BspA family leucine-rich repeat surface protein [uncultured Ruminococcus sp.]
MKAQYLKKAAAAVLALSLVCGGLPSVPGGKGLLNLPSLSAKAASSVSFDEATGTLTLSGNVERSEVMAYACNPNVTKVIAEEGAVLPADCSEMFFRGNMMFGDDDDSHYEWENLTEVDLSKADSSNVTDMSYMFADSTSWSNINKIDLSNFDTSNVTNMRNMFYNCKQLEEIDLSSFDTSNVTDMKYMFSNCVSLKKIYVTDKWSIESLVEKDNDMFYNCQSLVGGFGTSYYKNIDSAYYAAIDKVDDYAYLTDKTGSAFFDTSTGTLYLRGNVLRSDVDKFRENPGYISKVVAEEGCVLPADCSYLFYSDDDKRETFGPDNDMIWLAEWWYLTEIDLSKADTSNVTDMSYMFGGDGISTKNTIKKIDLSNFDTSNVTNMEGMFAGCQCLEELDLSSFDTSNVTNMNYMFGGCTDLKRIYVSDNWNADETDTHMFINCDSLVGGCGTTYSKDHISGDYARIDTKNTPGYFTDKDSRVLFDASTGTLTLRGNVVKEEVQAYKENEKVTRIVADESAVFPADCSRLFSAYISDTETGWKNLREIDLSKADTSNVTDMRYMFSYASSVQKINLSGIDTSKVSTMEAMFNNCKSLTTLDISGFDTSNVTNMDFMFYHCEKLEFLDLSGFNTSKVTSMGGMFNYAYSLKSLNVSSFDTSNVTYMGGMFYNLNRITSIDVSNFDTSKVTYMGNMFGYCLQLRKLDLSSFDTSKVTNAYQMFTYCNNLKTVYISDKWNTDKMTSSENMFNCCFALTGKRGTAFDSNYTDKTYARDDTVDNPGYFTAKNSAVFDAATGTLTLSGNVVKSEVQDFAGNENVKKVVAAQGTVLPSDCSHMFENFKAGTIDLSKANTAKVYLMNDMFYNCTSLSSLNISGFDTHGVISMRQMFRDCTSLKSINTSSFDTSNVRDMGYMFYNCSSLISLDLKNFNTSNVNTLFATFWGCTNLTSLNVRSFDTSKVTNMAGTFGKCESLKIIDMSSFDTSKLTGTWEMFEGCKNLKLIYVSYRWTIDNVTRSNDMFKDCISVEGAYGTHYNSAHTDKTYARVDNPNEGMPGYFIYADTVILDEDTFVLHLRGNVDKNELNSWKYVESVVGVVADEGAVLPADCSHLFDSKYIDYYMSDYYDSCWINLKSVDLSKADTSNVTNMGYMFNECSFLTNINLSGIDTSNVRNMSHMFYGCSSVIVNVNSFNTSNVTNMDYMFALNGEYSSMNLSSFDTSKVKDMSHMFDNCWNIKQIYVSDKWNTDNVTNSQQMFYNCWYLQGGNGTGFNNSYIDKTYARIDDFEHEGYLTNLCDIFDKNTGTLYLRGFINKTDVQYYRSNMNVKKVIAEEGAVLPANCSEMFYDFQAVSIDLSNADSSHVENMNSMFENCHALTTVDMSEFDLSALKSMTYAFSGDMKLTTIYVSSNWTIPENCNSSDMFNLTESIKGGNGTVYDENHTSGDYARIDKAGQPGYLTGRSCYLDRTSGTLYLSGNIAASDIAHYKNNSSVKNVVALEGSVLPADCSGLFISCDFEKIDLSKADSSNVTDTESMFNACGKLKTVDLTGFCTSKVTKMGGMFFDCGSLTSLDLSSFDTGKLTNTDAMFWNCSALSTVYVSDKWDMSKVTSSSVMFTGCTSLVGGNGTAFSSGFTDKTYARVDKEGQPGYLTFSCCSFDSATGTLILSGNITKKQVRKYYNNTAVKKVIATDTAVFPAASSVMFQDFKAETIDLSKASTSDVTNMGYMFAGCNKLKNLDISSFDTSKVTNMQFMFSGTQLTDIDVSSFNTSNVNYMDGMFYNCKKITDLDLTGFNTSKVTNMKEMFCNCTTIRAIKVSDKWTTNAVTNSINMFANCKRLEGANGTVYNSSYTDKTYARIDKAGQNGYFSEKCSTFDETTGTLYLFGNVSKAVVSVYSGNTAVKKVIAQNGAVLPEDCSLMFSGFKASEIDLSKAETQHTAIMYGMFYNCTNLKSLNISCFDTFEVLDMNAMFASCSALTELDLRSFDTENVGDMEGMFENCSSLRTIYVSDKWTVENVSYSTDMFAGCVSLVGGNGTVYNSSKRNKRYAHIDKADDPGYLSERIAKIVSNSMTLGSSISLNFYADLSVVPTENLKSTTMDFVVNGKKQTAKFDIKKRSTTSGNYYFTCKLNAVSMADPVTATLKYYDENRTLQMVTTTATAESYLEKFNSNDPAALWNLIKAINDYGYYMQRYLSIHSGNPWNLGVDHVAMKRAYVDEKTMINFQKNAATQLAPYQKTQRLNKDISKINYSLALDSDTSLIVKITPSKKYTGLMKVSVDGKETTATKLSDGRYQIVIPGISAHQLGDAHVIAIETSNGNSRVILSALSYAYECVKEPLDDTELCAMIALYSYFKAAEAYKG